MVVTPLHMKACGYIDMDTRRVNLVYVVHCLHLLQWLAFLPAHMLQACSAGTQATVTLWQGVPLPLPSSSLPGNMD